MNASMSAMLPGDRIRIAVDTSTEPFWQAAKERRLTACRCADCGAFRMPPRPFCPVCRSRNVQWPTLPGTATVYSYAVCHKSPYPEVADFTYIPVVVELDGAPGVRLVSNVVGVDPGAVTIGMRLQVDWHPILDDWVLPIFRRA
jgi:uncharacterized OB-fold protein